MRRVVHRARQRAVAVRGVVQRGHHADEIGLGRRPLAPQIRRRRPLQRRRQRGGVGADVIHLRARALLRLAHLDRLAAHESCDLRARIVEVAGDDRALRTHDHARGLEPHLHAVRAVVALGGGVRVGVDVERVVGAALHARLAADAARAVEVDDAVGAPIEGHRRADGDTRRVIAVVAAQHGEVAARVRPGALLDVLHPRAERSEGNLVLLLARHRARVTADALAMVDHESVSHF